MSADEKLAQTFAEFDSDDDGYITAPEFKLAMSSRGDAITEDDLESIFANTDYDQDGRINLAEFTEAWNA
jgi:Ca2+-binding EF-hand superfamily protein